MDELFWKAIGDLPAGVKAVFAAIAMVLSFLFGGTRLRTRYAKDQTERIEADTELDLRERVAAMDTLIKRHGVRLATLEADMAGLAAAFSSVLLCEGCRGTNRQLLDMMQRIFDKHDHPDMPQGKDSHERH